MYYANNKPLADIKKKNISSYFRQSFCMYAHITKTIHRIYFRFCNWTRKKRKNKINIIVRHRRMLLIKRNILTLNVSVDEEKVYTLTTTAWTKKNPKILFTYILLYARVFRRYIRYKYINNIKPTNKTNFSRCFYFKFYKCWLLWYSY